MLEIKDYVLLIVGAVIALAVNLSTDKVKHYIQIFRDWRAQRSDEAYQKQEEKLFGQKIDLWNLKENEERRTIFYREALAEMTACGFVAVFNIVSATYILSNSSLKSISGFLLSALGIYQFIQAAKLLFHMQSMRNEISKLNYPDRHIQEIEKREAALKAKRRGKKTD